MMNKKIIMSLVVVVVAVTAGIFTMDYTNNYDPFSDSKYANNISTETEKNDLRTYSTDKTVLPTYALFEAFTFKQIVDESEIIISGSIKDVEYIQTFTMHDNIAIESLNTIYTVTVEGIEKGKPQNEIKYIVMGGETEDYVRVFAGMFVFEENDQVMLFLSPYDVIDGKTIYTPITNMGVYKITNDIPNREVHKYGEEIFIPLSEFKSMIGSIVD